MKVDEMRRELSKLYNGAAKWKALLAKANDNQIIAIWYRTSYQPTKVNPIELIPRNKQLTLF
jgi:hypothetical protein